MMILSQKQKLDYGMVEETTLTRAHKASDSLRTTIPKSIVKHYKLNEGDKLEWDFEVVEGELVIIIRPGKEKSKK
jgi:bifunctional DNA-binding transcriptional regulator/antitoxin component of YhaV-PrlF toxin-antitoxin module